MDLFNGSNNLLPYDGEAIYLGPVFSHQEADEYYQMLLHEIPWEHDQVNLFGKRITTKRKVAWYGDQAFTYTYSKVTKTAKIWTEGLRALKNKIEVEADCNFNSCLLNFYHSGNEGMAWHSDAEKELLKHGTIASLSFGASRKFSFKHKESQFKQDLVLEHGSLLLMKGSIQDHWLHRLPPTKKVHSPRINLTFRTIKTS